MQEGLSFFWAPLPQRSFLLINFNLGVAAFSNFDLIWEFNNFPANRAIRLSKRLLTGSWHRPLGLEDTLEP